MNASTLELSTAKFDGGAMFGHAPKALWSRWADSDDRNRIACACRTLVVDSGHGIWLFDAGIGDYLDPTWADRYGLPHDPASLPSSLAAMGIKEDDVRIVVFSHLHFDHAGGVIPAWPAIQDTDWTPLFPNANYIVSEEQFARASKPHPKDRASYAPGLPEKLAETKRLILVGRDTTNLPELGDRVHLSQTDGHTPGLLHALIRGAEKTLFFASDLVLGTAWLNTSIISAYDRYPEALIDEKTAILNEAVDKDWLVVYPHDPAVAASGVTRNDKGRFEALNPLPTLKDIAL